MVVVVETLLEISGKVRMPFELPPMYPTDSEPEHPEQDRIIAPPERILLEDSASGVVSLGPVVHVPADMSRIQFTSFVWYPLAGASSGGYKNIPVLQWSLKWWGAAIRKSMHQDLLISIDRPYTCFKSASIWLRSAAREKLHYHSINWHDIRCLRSKCIRACGGEVLPCWPRSSQTGRCAIYVVIWCWVSSQF